MNEQRKSVAVMCFSSGSGGMEHDAVKLASLLGKEMDVVLFCKKDAFIHKLHKDKSVDYELEPVAFSSRTFSLSMLLGVRSSIKKHAIDNVVFFGASELKTLYFSFLGLDINLLIRHGTTKSKAKTDWFHRLIYSRVNYHIALSKHLLNNVTKIVPDNGIAVYKIIYPSYVISSQENAVNEEENGGLRITHVGRVASGKGQIDAVRACRVLYENGINFQLDILGGLEGDDYTKALESEIGADEFSRHIHLRGHVTNVTQYLKATDIFLFPSLGEGMPNAFIEAMHHNTVCIAYDNTVFPEFREMGFYIHIVRNADVSELSQKLLAVANNISDEKDRSEVNVNLVPNYFRVEQEIAQWREVLV